MRYVPLAAPAAAVTGANNDLGGAGYGSPLKARPREPPANTLATVVGAKGRPLDCAAGKRRPPDTLSASERDPEIRAPEPNSRLSADGRAPHPDQ